MKSKTGSKLGFAIVATSRLRAESFKLSVWLQEWLHAEVGKARRNCDLYVFSASRKHFISTHSLPTVFIRANPHRPPRPLREIRSPPFQICSLPLATIGTIGIITIGTIASYPDRGLHSPPGKRVVGTIASRTIKIRAGHIDRGWPSSCNLCKYSDLFRALVLGSSGG